MACLSSPAVEPALCVVCSAPHSALSVRRHERSLYSCSECGCEFLYPQPSDEVLAAVYGEDYFLGSDANTGCTGRSHSREIKRATSALYFRRLQKRLSIGRPKILEIGCGTGDFLAEAQACGGEVAGIEYSPFAVRQANERLGGEFVRCGSIDTVSVPPGAYDAVVFFDVIEHVRSPRGFLERVHEALKPGGVVALVTPSLDSWSRRSLGRYWVEYKTEHLVYFNIRGLRLLLETCGFEQVSVESNYKFLSLEYVCWHFERFRVPVISSALLGIRRLVPHAAARRPLRVPASGLAAFAYRSAKRGV